MNDNTLLPTEQEKEIIHKYYAMCKELKDEADSNMQAKSFDEEANGFIYLVRKYSKKFDIWIHASYPGKYINGGFITLWVKDFGDLLGDKVKWLK